MIPEIGRQIHMSLSIWRHGNSPLSHVWLGGSPSRTRSGDLANESDRQVPCFPNSSSPTSPPPLSPPIFLGVLLRSVPEIRHKKESKKRIDWWHVIHAFLFPSPIIPGNVSLKRLGARSRRMDKVRHWSEEKKRQAKLECSSVTSANYVRPFPIHGDRYTGFIMRLG